MNRALGISINITVVLAIVCSAVFGVIAIGQASQRQMAVEKNRRFLIIDSRTGRHWIGIKKITKWSSSIEFKDCEGNDVHVSRPGETIVQYHKNKESAVRKLYLEEGDVREEPQGY